MVMPSSTTRCLQREGERVRERSIREREETERGEKRELERSE